MTRLASFLERLPESRGLFAALLALMLLLFAIGNVPWHLDNYDQAKQAYVAFEIQKTGALWLQHTPQGRSASKPPLMGWVSAGLRAVGLPWELAWRLPSLVCALALLAILIREGRTVLGQAGATLAVAAFGLNLLSPRLATLVRTDMMLGFCIFVVGWMIWRKLRAGTPWTTGERWIVFAGMTAALLTKGPVIYAFLLPGLVAFAFLGRKNRGLTWSGWWTWLVPLALFLAWGIASLLSDPSFYHDVVQREFLSRFQEGGRSDERQQPLWFYFPHLLHKFAPWSLLLVALALCFPQTRRALRESPPVLWLVLWSVGGLLLMTFIPAKRVDRIFPVVPPFCLLLVEWCAVVWADRRVRVMAGISILAAILFAGGYFLGLVPLSYHERAQALVEFSEKARVLAAAHGVLQVQVPRARDEGLLLYFDAVNFADYDAAFAAWKSGRPCAIVLSDRSLDKLFKEVGHVTPAMDSGELTDKNERRYYLFLNR